MTKQELKLLGVAGASVVLLAISLFGMAWFQIAIDAAGMLGEALPDGAPSQVVIDVDLDSASTCHLGACATVPLDRVSRGGPYVWFGGIALWLGRALLIAVAIQAGLRLITKNPIPLLAKLGMYAAAGTFVCGFLAGYVFGSTGSQAAMGIGVTVTRTWAPAMLLLGAVCAMSALYLTRTSSVDDVDAPVITRSPPSPPVNVGPAAAAGAPDEPPPPTGDLRYGTPNRARRVSRMPSSIPLDDEPAPRRRAPSSIPLDDEPRAHTAGSIPLDDQPVPIRYAVTSLQISPDGFEATRDSGARGTVAWSDVVGIVVRRLPPEAPYDGIPVVDLISTPGATVRITPATRVVGASLRATSPEDDARAFAKLAIQRSPNARLDAATRTFLEGRTAIAQLPDAATLAEHDRRLA